MKAIGGLERAEGRRHGLRGSMKRYHWWDDCAADSLAPLWDGRSALAYAAEVIRQDILAPLPA